MSTIEDKDFWINLAHLELSNYNANKEGQIWSIKRNKIMDGSINQGYIIYNLTKDKAIQGQPFRGHRIIAIAFLGLHEDATYTVDHIDKNRSNNKLSNLRWASLSEQGLNQDRPAHIKGRNIYQYDLNGNLIRKWNTITEASLALNIQITNITKACRGVYKQSGRYIWKYAEDVDIIENEIWYPYINNEFKGDITGSNLGNIRMNNQTVGSISTSGYYNVKLQNVNTGKLQSVTIHSIIAYIFYGKRPESLIINHKDGNRLNNNCENLEYITQQENIQHGYKIGLNKTIKVYQFDMNYIFIKEFASIREAGASVGRPTGGHISECCSGKYNHCYGYIWRKAEDCVLQLKEGLKIALKQEKLSNIIDTNLIPSI